MEKLEQKLEALGPGIDVLRLKGFIDSYTCKDLKDAIEAFGRSHLSPRLYVDMSGIQYVGSSGWAVLFLQATALGKMGGALCIGALSERVERALHMVAPRNDLIKVVARETEALLYLQALSSANPQS